ncbi:MAG: hypothetical protein HYV28_08945, partial [Ignavibacteriales bacterium]|nr:hypothetical protein [Ignavibacteriales bacterium]
MDTREQFSPENLVRFAELVPSPVVICNTDKDVIAYNAKAGDFFSISGDGFSFFQLVQPSEQGKINQLFAESLKSRRALEEIISLKNAAGTFIKGRL